jgi:hypothetical protein
METVILLTGTIYPNNMGQTVLQDPVVRKEQYKESIYFYLKKTNLKIVFVENSNTDISNDFINENTIHRLEFLMFDGNNYSRKFGKGYGEMKILNYAFENSVFIKNCDFVIKITGRIKIKNINIFINQINRLLFKEFFILDFQRNLKWADSRLFIFYQNFFSKYLQKYGNQIDDSREINFEHALCKASLEAILDNVEYYPLTDYPVFSGSAGTTGKKYNENIFFKFLRHFKYRFKYFCLTR